MGSPPTLARLHWAGPQLATTLQQPLDDATLMIMAHALSFTKAPAFGTSHVTDTRLLTTVLRVTATQQSTAGQILALTQVTTLSTHGCLLLATVIVLLCSCTTTSVWDNTTNFILLKIHSDPTTGTGDNVTGTQKGVAQILSNAAM